MRKRISVYSYERMQQLASSLTPMQELFNTSGSLLTSRILMCVMRVMLGKALDNYNLAESADISTTTSVPLA